MVTAMALPSPYRPGATTDPDLKFAAYTMAVWGPFLGPWREQQRFLLMGFGEALQPMTEAMRRRMPELVKRVAVKKKPALIVLFTVFIRWRDRRLTLEYIKSHQIVGHIEPSGVFRARGGADLGGRAPEGLPGDEAVTLIDKMMSRPPRKDSEDIEKLMEAETKKGYQSKPVHKAEMDKKYGIGKWRPMPVFINEESGGKQRIIANAKGGGHNAWTSDEETLFVIAEGFAADAALMITEECIRFHLPSEAPNWQTEKLPEEMPSWAQCGLGCDDMMDAFRQSLVSPEQQGVNVVASLAPSESSWRFSEVHGPVYGMKSSVLHFNRLPSLASAVARSMGGSATGPYVDDFNTVDFMAPVGLAYVSPIRSSRPWMDTLAPTNISPPGSSEQQVMLGPMSAWTPCPWTARSSSSPERRRSTRLSRWPSPSSPRRRARQQRQPSSAGWRAGRLATRSAGSGDWDCEP